MIILSQSSSSVWPSGCYFFNGGFSPFTRWRKMIWSSWVQVWAAWGLSRGRSQQECNILFTQIYLSAYSINSHLCTVRAMHTMLVMKIVDGAFALRQASWCASPGQPHLINDLFLWSPKQQLPIILTWRFSLNSATQPFWLVKKSER